MSEPHTETMNNAEALAFIRTYFHELFGKHNIAALDEYLDPAYFDDDIGDPAVDHIQNSKAYLHDLFRAHPTAGVEVIDAMIHDDTICAFLEWYLLEGNARRIIRKGVAIFTARDQKFLKRHTFIYYEPQPLG